jgi:hypothetical protein
MVKRSFIAHFPSDQLVHRVGIMPFRHLFVLNLLPVDVGRGVVDSLVLLVGDVGRGSIKASAGRGVAVLGDLLVGLLRNTSGRTYGDDMSV